MSDANATKAVAVVPEAPIGPATVAVSDIHVRYRVPSADRAARAAVPKPVRIANRLLGRSPQVLVRALSGVSFVARSGESVGVIGRNGSGKSTLLRIMAGLETPARGTVMAQSNPVLLGVNAALIPNLPGEQNVRLGLLAMGKSPEETERMLPDVIDLAGIGKAIYLPMRTYSSGMASRLRFAIAAASRPDILLIDEALTTGDAAFRDRSEQKMTELRKQAGTVFLVSHAARTIEETCTRAIWIHQGKIVADGTATETAAAFGRWARCIAQGDETKAESLMRDAVEAYAPAQISFTSAPRESNPPRHAILRR
ncbi:ABC transporter ATP-binding protein [Georgenia sp. AZ-5]|uniref:ABC transporter ATP-binding protein n=1 Tax=Georgenia sp. AZ-5 TaxID=3367526 RepID=UPI003754CFFB